MSRRIKVGVVGYGYAGEKFHAYLVSLVPELELYAVAARKLERREAAAARHGVKTYESIEQLVADDAVELVVIATPHDSHAELSITALNAGKHVVTDKIMAMTVAETDAMVAAAERNGRMLSVFHNRRWDGDYLTVRKVIADGTIGSVFAIESAVTQYSRPRSTWRTTLSACGGQLFDWGAHLVDHALQLAGELPSTLFCTTQHLKWETEVDTHLQLQMRFPSDLIYAISLSRLCRSPKPRWYVLGEEGAFVKHGLDPQEQAMVAGDIDSARDPEEKWGTLFTGTDTETAADVVPPVPGRWRCYYENIAAHLLQEEPLAVTAAQARDVVRVVTAAMQSATEDRAISLSRD